MNMTSVQINMMKRIADAAMITADGICKAMQEAGIGNGSLNMLSIYINPNLPRISISFGDENNEECGYFQLTKCWEEDAYAIDSKSSLEYQVLFASKEQRDRLRGILQGEKELPPDGLWLSDSDDSAFLDRGVSVNDSMAES